jgi:hypothetical protein
MRLAANNIVDNYGGWLGGGLHIWNSADIELTDNIVISNLAYYVGGGGINLDTTDNVTLTGNSVISNSTGPNVASVERGVRLINSTNINLTSNTVANGSDSIFGGGLYLENSSVTMTNDIIADNQASIVGSGLYITRSSTYLLHTTIADNTGGDGSGIYITGTTSSVALTNTILVSHTVGITAATGNTVTLNGVLWYRNTTNVGGADNITATNEYTGDPVFVDPGAGDYHIGLTSAAIDRGISTTVDSDIDGDPRPQGCKADIGADEYRSGPCTPPTGVDIDGPTQGVVHASYTFTATVSPSTTTLPISYIWQVTGQDTMTTTTYSLSNTASFTWPTTGSNLITVTATNAVGTVSDTHVITICLCKVYLPVVMRNFPRPSFEYNVGECLPSATAKDAQVEIYVEGNDVVVNHYNAIYNCCAVIVVDFSDERPLLKLIERETFPGGFPCPCICPYDINARIADLPPGDYRVEVWNEDQSHRYGWANVTIPPTIARHTIYTVARSRLRKVLPKE